MDIGIVSKRESQGLRLIGKCFFFCFFPTHYLVASGKKYKILEHYEMWFGTGLGEVEQPSEHIKLKQD